MVVGHVRPMGGPEHWPMTAEANDSGAIVNVIAKRPSDLPEIRALGPSGMMLVGTHHQMHHWFLATGDGPMGHH
jgi:hypothetical protein